MTPLSVNHLADALEANPAASCLVVGPDLAITAELIAHAEFFRFGDTTMPNALKGRISYRVDRAMPPGEWRVEAAQ